MLAHTRLPPPATPPPTADGCGGRGVEFRRKLHFLSSELHLDPFPLLALHPALRSAPLPLLRDSLRLLASHGLSAHDAARVFSSFPSLLTSPPEEPLRFLSADVPLPPPLLRAAVVRSPRLLAASVPDTLRPALRFLRVRVALRREPLPLAAALLLAFSVERTLLPKLLFLRGATGLPESAVCAVLRRAPTILSYGIETNLTPKLQFLAERMGRDPAVELAEFPHYFAFSLKGRIRPRHEALIERGIQMSLKDMLTSNDDEFRERLIDGTLSDTKVQLSKNTLRPNGAGNVLEHKLSFICRCKFSLDAKADTCEAFKERGVEMSPARIDQWIILLSAMLSCRQIWGIKGDATAKVMPSLSYKVTYLHILDML